MGILFNSCSALQEVSNVCKMGTRCLSWRSLWPRRRDVTTYPASCDRKVDREEVRGEMVVTWMGEGITEQATFAPGLEDGPEFVSIHH